MAFLGRIGGPCLSEIIDQLGNEYFGISATALQSDVDHEELSEMSAFGEKYVSVLPVYKDKNGQLCYIFSAPNKKLQLYYLTPEEIKILYKIPIVSIIPEDINVAKSIGMQIPVVMMNPNSPASLEFMRMAEQICGYRRPVNMFTKLKRFFKI